MRASKLEPRKAGSFLEGLRRLGRVPAGPRDKRPVKPIIVVTRNTDDFPEVDTLNRCED